MEFIGLLDVLEEQIVTAPKVPMSGKCMIAREEIIELLTALRDSVPKNIVEANYIKDERQQILDGAKKEAAAIVREAKNRFEEMVTESEVTKAATERGEVVVENAKSRAMEIREKTTDYVDKTLASVETLLGEKINRIKEDRKSLRDK